MPTHGLVLVDYDNFRLRDARNRALSSLTTAEHELQATDIIDCLALALRAVLPDLAELDLLMYGGWTEHDGIRSNAASQLIPIMADLRGRHHGVIIRPNLTEAMAAFPHLALRGTIRGSGRRRRQKMVDSMLGFDLHHFAKEPALALAIASDDDDMIPALLTANDTSHHPTLWIRRRAVGAGLNDRVLQRTGLHLYSI